MKKEKQLKNQEIKIDILGCVCFGWKWFQEIIFTLFRMFGCNGKYNFPEIAFLLTKIYPFDPEMNLHSHFYFNSFPGHSPRTATQRDAQQHREKERRETQNKRTHRENELRSLNHLPRPPIHEPRASIHQPSTPIHEPRAPIHQPIPPIHQPRAPIHKPRALIHEHPIQLSQTHTGPATSVTEPNTLSRWVFRHRFTIHTLTSPPTHTCPIHTLTSSVWSLHLYIYIYIYIFIYFFLFINFFNYQCFIKLCIYGLCIWNVGAFLFAGYWRLVFGLLFFFIILELDCK